MSVMLLSIEKPTECYDCPCFEIDEFHGFWCRAVKGERRYKEIDWRKCYDSTPDWCPMEQIEDSEAH